MLLLFITNLDNTFCRLSGAKNAESQLIHHYSFLHNENIGHKIRPHRFSNREIAVIADKYDVEDRRSAEKIVYDQPQLAKSFPQHPFPCQDVGHIHGYAEGTCGKHQSKSNIIVILNSQAELFLQSISAFTAFCPFVC